MASNFYITLCKHIKWPEKPQCVPIIIAVQNDIVASDLEGVNNLN